MERLGQTKLNAYIMPRHVHKRVHTPTPKKKIVCKIAVWCFSTAPREHAVLFFSQHVVCIALVGYQVN